jgi:prefoldin alpha subunit
MFCIHHECLYQIYGELAEFLALKNSISAIEAAKLKPGEPLKTKVDLGCNFYVQARVPDPNKIFLEVGLGFFVELSLAEALKVIGKRTEVLEKEAERLSSDSCKIKANIKLTLEGLRELQSLSQIGTQFA